MELKREIKLALVGDARVGKTSWVSRHIDGEESPHYTPTIGYECRQCFFTTNLGDVMFDIWDISGSHSTAQDRAQWIHDSDAAIIMVDMADLASIENAVNWYREILLSQKYSDRLTSLPVLIYSRKAYKKSDKRAMDPTEISWSNEMGDTPVFYNPYVYLAGPEAKLMEAAPGFSWDSRPIIWILEQLTGQKVEFHLGCCSGIPGPAYSLELEKQRAEMDEATKGFQLHDDDDADL